MKKHIPRQFDNLGSFTQPGRATVIYGPRRVGKTTLVNQYIANLGGKVLSVTGDDSRVSSLLEGHARQQILAWAEGYDTIFVDEAQQIPNIGLAIKELVDSRPALNIILTGSASLELSNKVGEPLTGRQTPLQLFPISLLEMSRNSSAYELSEQIDDMLVYGMYPEVRTATTVSQKQFILNELTSSYLLRDVLAIERVKSPRVLNDLLTLLALQVGSEVSINELARKLGVDAKTVARYLDLLEKSYVIYNLRGFSRNLRSEVTRTSKYYFYDNGVRNAVISNYNPLKLRGDVGALWENFMIMERLKMRAYMPIPANDYFWRTWEQNEIDLLEERGGELWAYEFKWSPKKHGSAPARFMENYPDAHYEIISPKNWTSFILER